MASPVDDLGEHDPGDEGGADDEKRCGALATLLALLLRLGPRAELRPRGRRRRLRRRVALGARLDEARLQLAQEVRVVPQFLRELLADAVAASGRAIGKLLQAVGAALDQHVALVHRFTGGASPVATRQIPDAARRATIVAPAARPA